MPSFFDSFSEITGKSLPDPSDLTTDQKAALAYQLRQAGEKPVAIAVFRKPTTAISPKDALAMVRIDSLGF